MRDFFEGVGRVLGFVVLLLAVVWVRSETQPKPVYATPVMPTFRSTLPTDIKPIYGDLKKFDQRAWDNMNSK